MNYQFFEQEHVHTLDEQPLYGTSTVIKEVLPPFLAKWGAQCAVDHIAGKLEFQVIDGHGEYTIGNKSFWDVTLAEAPLAYTKVRDSAAEKGTKMHSDLEAYCLSMIASGGEPQYREGGAVAKFSKWAVENIQTFLLAETHVFSKELWTGGIVDCMAHLRTGELAIIDFKSSREAYFNQVVQAGAYALQFEENGALTSEGSQVLPPAPVSALVIVPFGSANLSPEKFTNVKGFKDAFRHIVEIYKLQQAFKKR